MALFSPNISVNNIKDPVVRNYLIDLNESLTYMFQNLTADDNYASSEKETLESMKSKIEELEEKISALGG